MKRILTIVALLMILAMLSSCNKSDIEKESASTNNENVSVNENVEYVIYADYSAGNSSAVTTESSSIPVKSATEKVFSFSKSTKINRLDSAVDNYTFSVDGKTYTASFSKSYENLFGTSEKVRKFSQYNRYADVTDSKILEVNAATGEIEFFAGNPRLTNEEGNLTEIQAKEKAIAIITELYGADVFDEYEYKHTLESMDNGGEKQDGYSVVYKRYVHGIPTDDDIQITLNMKGELFSVNAKGKGMLANAEKDITKEQIDNAIKAVKEKFSDSWSVHDSSATIVMDSEGDYYVRMGISRNTNGMVTAVQIYINIK